MQHEFYTCVCIYTYTWMHICICWLLFHPWELPRTPRAPHGESSSDPPGGDQSQHLTARSSGQTVQGPAQPAVDWLRRCVGHRLPGLFVRSGESTFSAWGDAFGQNDPWFSPLMPYWQHSSVFKPFCTNKPTSFQHPTPQSISQLYEMVGKRQALWNSFIYVNFSLDTKTHVNCCYH